MPHPLFIDNDFSSQVIFKELCNQVGIPYVGIQNSTQVEGMLDGLLDVNVVLLDLEMPHRNGYEILEVLRKHPNFAHVPIVACTVHSTEMDQARSAGFDSFIVKPLNVEIFLDQLKEIVRGKPVWETH